MNNVGTAYVLWLGCLLQLYGLQRLYNGKIVTGLLWLFTFGLFGVGQLLDLVLIPGMVDEHNTRFRDRQGALHPGVSASQPQIERVVESERLPLPGLPMVPPPVPPPSPSQISPLFVDRLSIQLVKAAAARDGRISVTQGVLDTEASFAEVEMALKTLVRSGYVDTCNDVETGVVFYEFRELT